MNGPITAGRLRQLAAAGETDARLLERFAATGDEDAFAELVRRHGPLVLGACRRVLGSSADADDAAQATFVVLARKAGAVRDAGALGNWLFGVARLAALKARDRAARRRVHEANAARPEVGPPPEPAAADARATVDEELERLPARLRAPLIACLVQGRTQEEAARDTGVCVRTLRRRLDRARELLRARLAGRGVVPAVALAALGAPVPAAALDATAALAVAGTAGTGPAELLAKEVLVMMAPNKLKALGAALALLMLGGGAALALGGARSGDPSAQPKLPPVVVPPAPPPGAPREEVKPGDRFTFRATALFEQAPLEGVYEIEKTGKIALGPAYGGRVEIGGLTIEQAEAVLTKHIRQFALRAEITLVRHTGDANQLEARVRKLEAEVQKLRDTVEALQKK